MSPMEIDEVLRSNRSEINGLDAATVQTIQALVTLLQRRGQCAKNLGYAKMEGRMPICDPEREKQVKEHVRQAAGYGPLAPDQIEMIFEKIIEVCRRVQCAEVRL